VEAPPQAVTRRLSSGTPLSRLLATDVQRNVRPYAPLMRRIEPY
jgi:hypothetical protein